MTFLVLHSCFCSFRQGIVFIKLGIKDHVTSKDYHVVLSSHFQIGDRKGLRFCLLPSSQDKNPFFFLTTGIMTIHG
ncbi:hypothetical protein GQ457_03G000710 [Hibiscus cannabinus]